MKEIIKPFDLEKAKAEAKLRTRDGKPVEIFKWDARGKFPIKGMVEEEEADNGLSWTINGSCYDNGVSCNYDLTIVEEVGKLKFKIGDWITNSHIIVKIKELNENFYICENTMSAEWIVSNKDAETNYHLWTIKDAKTGDVLAFDNGHIILVKESHNSTWGWRLSCWCHLLDGEFEVVEYHTKTEGLHPATNKQRDLLFQKMKEAGYEWNAGKLELKKIKPEFWSDDVEKILNGFYINSDADIRGVHTLHNISNNYNVFATENQAKSSLAMARISQIMANDIKNFGGPITDKEWENDEWKFVIYRCDNRIKTISVVSVYYFLAFHTEKQRDLFLEKYPQLVKEYLCLD